MPHRCENQVNGFPPCAEMMAIKRKLYEQETIQDALRDSNRQLREERDVLHTALSRFRNFNSVAQKVVDAFKKLDC